MKSLIERTDCDKCSCKSGDYLIFTGKMWSCENCLSQNFQPSHFFYYRNN